MPFDPSTDLDPALMEPSDQFLRDLPPVRDILRPNTATSGTGSEDEEELPRSPMFANHSNTGIDISAPPSAIHTITSSDKMQATGRTLAKRMRLTTESEAELDRFCATTSQADHMIMIYAQGLQIRELLVKKQAVEEWKICDQLMKKNLKKYSQAFVLCPTVSAYRGNACKTILDALRELHIAHLPPPEENSQVNLVYVAINKYLTTYRNQVKKAIQSSVKESSEFRNVATLAHNLVGKNGPVQLTVQFYIWLAFLRWHVVNYPDANDDGYWLKVDETLASWRSKMTKEPLERAFNKMYEDDKEAYGRPDDTNFAVTNIMKLQNWQVVLNNHAGKVIASESLKRKRG